MQIAIETPEVPWVVRFDREVVEVLDNLAASSGELYEDTVKTVRKIADNPLCGSPKTGELKGFRADHITHLVVVWELNPNIVDRSHLEKVEEVYVHGIEHHDNMTDAVKGGRKPAMHRREFGVRFPGHDYGKEVSELHDFDGLEVRDEDWNGEGVEVVGLAEQGRSEAVIGVLPEEADIRVGKQHLLA